MATLNETNKMYRKLAQKAGVEGSTAFLQILRNQLNYDEAKLLVDLDSGATREHLAGSLNLDEKSLRTMLEDLVKRKFLLSAGSTGGGDPPGCVAFPGYNLPKTPRFYPHGPDTPQTKELWTELFRSGYMQKSVIDSFLARKQVTGLSPRRIIPARKALALSPKIPRERVLWYEDIEQILRRQEVISTGKCGCRRVLGCGLCIIKCPHQAMHLELVRPPEHIPSHSHLASRSSVLRPPPAQM